MEVHRVGEVGQHPGQHGQVLFRQLLLQVDRVGGNDGLFLPLQGEKNGRNKVGQRFSDAGAGLDGEMIPAHEGAGHGHGHLLLLRTELEVFRARKDAGRRKNLRNPGDQIRP